MSCPWATTWAEVTAPTVTQATPAITTQPANQSACSGGTATFSVTATGGSLGFLWARRGTGWGNAWSFSDANGLFQLVVTNDPPAAARYFRTIVP